MKNLAVITGFGGINAAGRSSGNHAFRRIVYDALNAEQQATTRQSLATLMGLSPEQEQEILDGTLVRGWDNTTFDPEAVPFHKPFKDADGNDCYQITARRMNVQSGGQLPKGFDPANEYRSRHHPRGLQMAIYAASDALGSLGIEWETLCQHLSPDQIGVYAGSAMGQLDTAGHGGMIQAAMTGKRTSSKQCPLGLSEMPADFVNAYVLGNLGSTGSMVGACATFLYNLRLAKEDIESGRRRLVVVGNAEAPLNPEIIEGYNAMTALVTEPRLRELDGCGEGEAPDFRRASRPFGENAGFTLSESAQFFVITDDELALELGLNILGSVGDVFVHADGYKKSISNPGVGNYLTMGKAMAAVRRQLGEDSLKHRSYIHAHGSSTPQNRTTESHIYQELAGAFGIKNWPVTAAKAHLGHSLAAASADQTMMALGGWVDNILPGITTTHAIADDVYTEGVDYRLAHRTMEPGELDVAFINSKGFGGNNASGTLLSPQITRKLLTEKHSQKALDKHQDLNEGIQEQAQRYDAEMSSGTRKPRYHFGVGVLEPENLQVTDTYIKIDGWDKVVPL